MSDYDEAVSRADNAANVNEQVDTMLRQNLMNESAAMRIFPIVPMSTQQTKMPVIAGLPLAFFVDGDTGLKRTTDMTWDKKFLNAEELAVIVPVPDAVLDDSSFDIWNSVRPHMENAVARAIDDAIFFGVNKPDSWGKAIGPESSSRSHTVTRGTAAANAGGIAADFSNLFALIEADGFGVDFAVANMTYRGFLRNARDGDGNHQDDVTPGRVYEVPVRYPMRGLWPTGSGAVSAVVGDRTQGIIGLRQDFRYRLLSEAVITDTDGNIVYNLAQQDMVALRITFRVAWQVANILTYDNQTEATRWPFGVMVES